MSAILGIDTSTDKAFVCLSHNGKLIDVIENHEQKSHASWLQPAVNLLLKNNNTSLVELNAVAVTIGPGSYTGLRVGLSAAKGYCYALKIPLLSLCTLDLMAHSVIEKATDYICPMIDARRMEVFTAIYDLELKKITDPLAMILHIEYFESLLEKHAVLFCGNGAEKLKPLLKSSHATFTQVKNLALSLSILAENELKNGNFSDIAYTEPLYLKDFHNSSTQPGGD